MNLPPESTLDAVVFELKDPDPAVRAQAATLLGLSGNPSIIEYLAQALSLDPSLAVRRAAATALGNLAQLACIQPLFVSLRDEDPALRSAGAEAIARIDAPEVALLLVQALDGGSALQRGALEALLMCGDDAARSALEARSPFADEQLETLRWAALAALGHDGQSAIEALETLAASPDAVSRRRALRARLHRGPTEFSRVLASLDDGDAEVRALAAEGLGAFGDGVALEPLVARLEDADAFVRSAAAMALAVLGDARAIASLNAAIDARDAADSSRQAMLEALDRLTAEAVG